MVDVDALAQRAADYGFAYLISITPSGRVHTSVVHPGIGDGAVTVPASDRVRRNVGENPQVSLVWPPADATGYSLIADGVGDEKDGIVTITPSRAILHRPATEPSVPGAADGCVQDCVEL
ncbi:hypothetical protein [Microbacterium terrisoli]|jgi:hypothetical protein|uniref:hypothetical protein n=1 Tax=Microbacterium terrisoli TaxID=3242192 RepID=UPI00280517C5|nr:hypothetical protein [Microbacterium protaetiae]